LAICLFTSNQTVVVRSKLSGKSCLIHSRIRSLSFKKKKTRNGTRMRYTTSVKIPMTEARDKDKRRLARAVMPELIASNICRTWSSDMKSGYLSGSSSNCFCPSISMVGSC